jgi:O-antigen/teichoic acid export membrane protein
MKSFQGGLSADILPWTFLISKFLAGQGAVQAINLVSGLLIIRFLPISEYALYTIASLLLVVGSLGSDMGLSQAVNTLGARIRDDQQALGSLYAGALRYRRMLHLVALGVMLFLATYMLYGHEWSLTSACLSVALVMLTSWVQQSISLKKSILNVHHDADGLLHAGSSEAISRLFSVGICVVWPTAVIALMVNLFGVLVGRYFLSRRCANLMREDAVSHESQLRDLRLFVIPLIPGVIYYMLQGQISIFFLSLYGLTSSIAEVGALSRLGQIIGLFMMLNAFLIQPYFARIEQKSVYISSVRFVIAMLFAFCLVIMISAYLVPGWWLFVLGEKYAGLQRELPLAIVGPLLTLLGGSLYTMVIARNVTRGQFWYIIVGIASQLMFISKFSVQTTFDALILNMLPSVGYIVMQSILLVRVLSNWDEGASREVGAT